MKYHSIMDMSDQLFLRVQDVTVEFLYGEEEKNEGVRFTVKFRNEEGNVCVPDTFELFITLIEEQAVALRNYLVRKHPINE